MVWPTLGSRTAKEQNMGFGGVPTTANTVAKFYTNWA